MQSKPSSRHSRAYALSIGVVLFFLACTSAVDAQSFYLSLGPASFSTNWGARRVRNQFVRQRIIQRAFRAAVYAPRAQYAPPPQYSASAQYSEAAQPTVARAEYVAPPQDSTAGQQGKQDTYVGVDDPQAANYPEATPETPRNSFDQPTVPGHRAVLRHGVAYAPADAPLPVKKAIWAINTIRNKPYVWGGGHDSFYDPRGYDCSGTVSFALHYAGQLGAPTTSQSLMSYGAPGPGHWMTVFARDGHTWMEIAGLRLDTTGYYGNEGPRWRDDYRSPWGFTERHPVGL